ncbi:hypothetical protein H4R34_001671 [Dimargaris verticillata]|uniref:DAGKc domain-containing protein n=1 Tax=Dimargaris verticillata TaxID=2761393 RepID=A0A9W8B5P4_9FUNG|nr:hypothetical protein H4R34_001671 [Dimargaris verticillata]
MHRISIPFGYHSGKSSRSTVRTTGTGTTTNASSSQLSFRACSAHLGTNMSNTLHTSLSQVIPGLEKWEERLLLMSTMQPNIFVVIFVNPFSGGQVGKELLKLKFQHFRLRHKPRTQIQWYNLFNQQDELDGIEYLRWILTVKECVETTLQRVGRDEITIYNIDPERLRSRNPNRLSGSLIFFDDENLAHLPQDEQDFIRQYGRRSVISNIEIHVWSAGGDGTVMSVYDLLVRQSISFSNIYFSCIPFGTGNDMSQALGWGRTVRRNLANANLSNLISLTETRLTGDLALLDVWEIEITTYPEGYIRSIRKNGNTDEGAHFKRRFCSIFSMGVQGFVGREFEPHRTKSRFHNIVQYTAQSTKWVTTRKFPVITEVLESISKDGEVIMRTRVPPIYAEVDPEVKRATDACTETATGQPLEDDPILEIQPIEIFVQNIPHIWGREYDIWGDAKYMPNVVSHQRGPTDKRNWKPQMSGDDRLELFAIENVSSYLRKQMSSKGGLARIGQVEGQFQLNFRNPQVYDNYREKSAKLSARHRAYPPGFTCLMIDGEFYDLYLPKSIKFRRHSCVRAIGSNAKNSRLVRDTHTYCQSISNGTIPTPAASTPTSPELPATEGVARTETESSLSLDVNPTQPPQSYNVKAGSPRQSQDATPRSSAQFTLVDSESQPPTPSTAGPELAAPSFLGTSAGRYKGSHAGLQGPLTLPSPEEEPNKAALAPGPVPNSGSFRRSFHHPVAGATTPRTPGSRVSSLSAATEATSGPRTPQRTDTDSSQFSLHRQGSLPSEALRRCFARIDFYSNYQSSRPNPDNVIEPHDLKHNPSYIQH